jgi:choline dehydrogenase-like flavoprotein
MANVLDHYDVIIIGSGAGGGALALQLAPSGKRILTLEREGWVRREKDNSDSKVANVDGRYQTKEVWRDRDGKSLHPHTNYNVGGITKFYGAALFRPRQVDFGQIEHVGGVSPAWLISFDELEPYYTQAEKLYHVHGARGEAPTEPRASGPFPYPAVSHEPRIQHHSDDLERLR